jgi:biopolymer transport protein ExbD
VWVSQTAGSIGGADGAAGAGGPNGDARLNQGLNNQADGGLADGGLADGGLADGVLAVDRGLAAAGDQNDAALAAAPSVAVEPVGGAKVSFGHDPVFESAGHHSATDMPTLPPALQGDADDDALPPRNKRKDDELDMTPMVDVTFLLLIFFMVTASFSLQKSLEMPRQQSDAPSTNVKEEEEEDQDMVTVQIDEYGSFLVLAADWERETPGKQNLTTALREAIGEGGSGAVRLVIEVHEDAQLKYLVDCMDAGAICGYGEIQVSQVDGFD